MASSAGPESSLRPLPVIPTWSPDTITATRIHLPVNAVPTKPLATTRRTRRRTTWAIFPTHLFSRPVWSLPRLRCPPRSTRSPTSVMHRRNRWPTTRRGHRGGPPEGHPGLHGLPPSSPEPTPRRWPAGLASVTVAWYALPGVFRIDDGDLVS